MLPRSWHTPRLSIEDAVASDLGIAHACLVESQDIARLDPAFAPVPPSEIEAHIARSAQEASAGSRAFQMQIVRLAASGEAVGYWHFMKVPRRPSAVGVSIMLIRPSFRRQGLGAELVAAALGRFDGAMDEIWARVYLGNVTAIEFWARLGFLRLTLLDDRYVSSPAEMPSIILSRPLEGAAPALPDPSLEQTPGAR